MHSDHRIEPERIAQPIGGALRIVARRIGADEDTEEPADLTNPRLDANLADGGRDMGEEILGVGIARECTKLDDESAFRGGYWNGGRRFSGRRRCRDAG